MIFFIDFFLIFKFLFYFFGKNFIYLEFFNEFSELKIIVLWDIYKPSILVFRFYIALSISHLPVTKRIIYLIRKYKALIILEIVLLMILNI